MVGEGVVKKRLEKLSSDLNLKNISFFSFLAIQMLPKLLASADCHLDYPKKGGSRCSFTIKVD